LSLQQASLIFIRQLTPLCVELASLDQTAGGSTLAASSNRLAGFFDQGAESVLGMRFGQAVRQ
jgi:hypothetical protein